MNNKFRDAKILIVEDEPQINRLIELVLQTEGYYKIRKAFDGEEALNLIKTEKPDLILMDVMIPKIDGFNLCKKITENKDLSSVQIIMLTAKKMEEDILKGFESGAVDYIEKPFSNKILLARIKARLSHTNINSDKKVYKNIELDSRCKIVKVSGKQVDLTKFEFILLDIFMENTGTVFSRSQLLYFLRGNDGFDISERAVDVQIVNLRRKLGTFGSNIETVRGIGYKLREVQ